MNLKNDLLDFLSIDLEDYLRDIPNDIRNELLEIDRQMDMGDVQSLTNDVKDKLASDMWNDRYRELYTELSTTLKISLGNT